MPTVDASLSDTCMVVCGGKLCRSGGTVQIWDRRNFLKVAGAATAASLAGAARANEVTGKRIHALIAQEEPAKPVAANDHIQIALIGAGGQGMGDTKAAVQVPGVKLVAVADCYNGRLERSKELWGDDIFHDAGLQRDSRAQGYRRRHHRHA